MRWLASALGYALLTCASIAQVGQIPRYSPVVTGGAGIILDPATVGHNGGASGTAITCPLNLTNANDVVLVIATINSDPITSITDNSGVTAAWSGANSITSAGGSVNHIEMWWTTATAAVSAKTITVNFGVAASFATIDCFGVSNAVASSFVDATNTGGADPISITTTNSKDMIIGGFRLGNASSTAGSGYTIINSADFQTDEYKAPVTANTYSITLGTGVGTANGAVAIAIKSQ